MGQNSSVAAGTTNVAPGDASDSCVSGVKLRSTGIIPISELIKQEKCSRNIQSIEKNFYNRKKTINKHPNEKFKSKKVKADFIETSFEDMPIRRQWVRVKPKPKNSFECDAVKIGLKKPSKTFFNDNEVDVQHEIGGLERGHREHSAKNNRNSKQENLQGNSHDTVRESIKVDVLEDAWPSFRKNVAIGTQEFNNKHTRKSKKRTEKPNSVEDEAKKSNNKYNTAEHKIHESSTQTISRDKAIFYENMKQLYKRNDFDEKIRSPQKNRDGNEYTKTEENKIKQRHPQKEFKHKLEGALRALKEESTHQIQTHEISHNERKLKKNRQHLTIKTTMLCSIPPEKHVESRAQSKENTLERCAGRNYINRKIAGECNNREEKHAAPNTDVNNSNSSKRAQSYTSLLPIGSSLENVLVNEHRKHVSAKEALASWKNLHTWKQQQKQFERTRNQFHQGNFDAATQTLAARPKSTPRSVSSNHQLLKTHPVPHEGVLKSSEKHLYNDFISKMEHCLQKHSKICELHTKRNGAANYTWVQDKHRRWHKITFDNYRESI